MPPKVLYPKYVNYLSCCFGIPLAYPVLIAVQTAVAGMLANFSAYRFDPGMGQLLAILMAFCVPWFLWILVVRKVVLLGAVHQSEAPIHDLLSSIKSLALDFHRLLGGAVKLVLICLFVGASGYLKEMISVIQPFAWDHTFMRVDRLLHFGVDPYRLSLWLFGSPTATTALNVAYHAWFFVIYFVTFVACFARTDDKLSQAFLVGLLLTFAVGGNAIALVFSSAGPVYYERLGLGSEFEPLMQHLRAMNEISPVWALSVQEGLWHGHVGDGELAGISAMPSMHVATSVLMAFYATTYARWAAWLMWGFALAILIGSVHLGWHYAIDGYLGAAIAWACWVTARYLVEERN
ncbi:PAP2 superfamily protein [Silicimonas algicola]|uniref:PAP2 superfamily protein n=2 Tax=Silicimonas algicola TaxID=1826607 RepID=A0A316G4Y4_9RHOB|nr:PAP2 superfamily protein [Silicimonas algicola]